MNRSLLVSTINESEFVIVSHTWRTPVITEITLRPITQELEYRDCCTQKNVLDRRSWATRDQLRIAIVTWIERTYHRRRRQDALGRLTPIEYETIMNQTVALAA